MPMNLFFGSTTLSVAVWWSLPFANPNKIGLFGGGKLLQRAVMDTVSSNNIISSDYLTGSFNFVTYF